MKNINIITYLVVILLSGCKNQNQIEQAVIRFTLQPNSSVNSSNSIYDVFTEPYYVPLETTKESLIGGIDKVIENGNIYYILDREVDQVLCFDKRGKFLHSVGKIGKGPGEYLSVDDLQVFGNIVYLLARDSKKIILFSQEGKFQKEIPLDGFYSNFIIVNNEHAVLYRNFSRNKHHTNLASFSLTKEKVISNFHKINESQFGQGYGTKCFDAIHKSTLFIAPNDYNIYTVTEKSTQPKYYIDFGSKYSLPQGSRYFNYKEMEDIDQKVVFGIDDLFSFDDIIMFTYVYSGIQNIVIVNITNKKVLFNGYPGPTLKSPIFDGMLVGKTNNEIISIADASSALNNFGSEEFKQARANLEFRKSLTREDNPILLISKIKKHE